MVIHTINNSTCDILRLKSLVTSELAGAGVLRGGEPSSHQGSNSEVTETVGETRLRRRRKTREIAQLKTSKIR